MIAVMMKEINEFLYSIIAYLVIGVFLIGVSIVLWVLPETSLLDYGYASMAPLFSIGPYLFMFLIPAITMKSFAEEKRSGTIELLYTLPLSSRAIVMGKFLAASLLVFFSLFPTMVYYYSIYQLTLVFLRQCRVQLANYLLPKLLLLYIQSVLNQ